MSAKVWVIDDDRSIRWVLERALQQAGIDVSLFDSADKALEEFQTTRPEVMISDIRMPGTDGLDFLQKIHNESPELPVIVMTAHSDLDSAVASYQNGAFEYLPKPFDIDEAVGLVRRALEHAKEQQQESEPQSYLSSTEIIGEAPAMQEVFRAIGRLSQSNITVLINGASGTGKELVAHALHKHSPRAQQAFIPLNMAAIPQDLIESELFGHEKGAFTGAAAARRGRFEQANGGTLFLDEIGDMPANAQTRLLRVLADGEFYRVGGHTSVKVDVRIIAATHQNLEQLVKDGRFREDLFHRLNVIRIQIPKLADRSEDVPQLAQHFLSAAAKELAVESKSLHPATADLMCQLPWPGNVRQLENTCRWLTVMASGREVLVADLPPELVADSTEYQQQADVKDKTSSENMAHLGYPGWPQALMRWTTEQFETGREGVINEALPLFEKAMIECALRHTGGRRREAAELIGWGRNTLTRKIKELEDGGFSCE